MLSSQSEGNFAEANVGLGVARINEPVGDALFALNLGRKK
jgi:hypothetical protein